MRFLLDENIPLSVLWWLMTQGYEAKTVREVGLVGRSDQALNAYLHRENRVLITLDLDFSDPIKLPLGPARIVLRPVVTDGELMQRLLRQALTWGVPQPGELWVVQPGGMARFSGA